jgi:hypothetical protein
MNIPFILIILLLLIFNSTFNMYLLNLVFVSRGLITNNCKWWKFSDLFIKDAAGHQLYTDHKEKYGSIAPIKMFGENIFLVTNPNYIKQILDNSPNTFDVGKIKFNFFKTFMAHNVGVSSGCPWKKRRAMNEFALSTNFIPKFAPIYDLEIRKILISESGLNTKPNTKPNQIPNPIYDFDRMLNIGKQMVSKIIFGLDKIDDNIFKIFAEANTIWSILNKSYQIDSNIKSIYEQFILNQIKNPIKNSLVYESKLYLDNPTEILHQIPHYMFPILGLYPVAVSRLLTLLANHPLILNKLCEELSNATDPFKVEMLRYCILETLRLNNPVTTTFRTLKLDYEFVDNSTKLNKPNPNKPNPNKSKPNRIFKKGDQFLILNNPVLRDKRFWSNPNKFDPSRWSDSKIEDSYYALSFNQGPQKCPGKELSIYLIKSFVINFFVINGILKNPSKLKANKIPTDSIPDMMNPCELKIIV